MNASDVVIVVGAYLLGAVPFGYIIYWLRSGGDIRREGSGNIGATNVARRAGLAAGVLTLVLDFAKGYVAVVAAERLAAGQPVAAAAAGVAALVGHMFPVYLKFRGGKGVATGLGVFLALAPRSTAVVAVAFVLTVALWRYVSLGSVLATALFPFVALLVEGPPQPALVTAFVGSALIIIRHAANIRRLLDGTEQRLQFHRT